MPRNILTFCHLRWNFVYQRPQHLLSRYQKIANVHLWEEPVFKQSVTPFLQCSVGEDGVTVITPVLVLGLSDEQSIAVQRALLDRYIEETDLREFAAWYSTPMALRFSDHLQPVVTIYDCMDELSAFQGAPPQLISEEQRLFSRADVVFCGGASLYASKSLQHDNVHLFPSSIDREHFAAARRPMRDPSDQRGIPHPRIGFYGVLDERLDRDLLAAIARLRPKWHFVLLGPVVKIRETDLPHAANLHYLGQKQYADLPAYLGNWEVAMLPFARNASTRFISPTKTPEYLAGGKPVVSTPIADVVRPYGEAGHVAIAHDAAEFVAAIERILSTPDPGWLARVDAMLVSMSWDKTFEHMWKEIRRCSVSLNASAEREMANCGGSEVNV
jgi:glycosyltransferase involved in cell wall biosynthesis